MSNWFKWLQRHFIPSKGNSYRPQFLNVRNTKQLVGILVFFELTLFILPVFNFVTYSGSLNLSAVLPSVLGTLTNEERSKNNLPALAVNPILAKAAQLKAEDMAAKSYFAHTSPEGKSPWYWFQLAGYKYTYAGENLAVNFSDSEEVTRAWINSPTHQANLVGKNYTEMGTGIATGTYKGGTSIFVVQDYARPAVSQGQGRALQSAASPSLLQSIMASPQQTTNTVLAVVFGIILAALFLNIFIKVQYQYPDLIVNGVLVILIIIGLHITNSFIAKETVETSFEELPPVSAQVPLG
jgi:hypothetical protein